MTALMTAPAAATLADMHPKPATDRSGLGQLVLVLKLAALMLDLPATLTPINQQRIELLIHLPRRLAMTMLAVIIPRPASRPARRRLRLPTRERRRLALGHPPRLLQLPLKLPDPRQQPLVLPRQTDHLAPQLLVLGRQPSAPRRQPTKLIHRLGRKHLNTRNGDGNHRHQDAPQAQPAKSIRLDEPSRTPPGPISRNRSRKQRRR